MDKYNGGYIAYHVEHFAPKEKFEHLKYTYDNLRYSCSYCNIFKSNKWVGKTSNKCTEVLCDYFDLFIKDEER
uniref:HNH endonuclease n=1 Tax=Paenibacillus sp. KS-LC4 TaxID=2979727 RepID=UPI00403F8105